jgi:hypothetical protein
LETSGLSVRIFLTGDAVTKVGMSAAASVGMSLFNTVYTKVSLGGLKMDSTVSFVWRLGQQFSAIFAYFLCFY